MQANLKCSPVTRVLAGLVPFAFILSGCGGTPPRCRPTFTKARNAEAFEATDIHHSSMLEARLTWKSRPVSDRSITFYLRRHDGYAVDVFDPSVEMVAGSATTDRNGVARLDLRKRSLDAYAHDAWAERYSAVFRADGKYCASSGSAKMSLVKSQAGDVDYASGSSVPVAVSPSPMVLPRITTPPIPRDACLTIPVLGRICPPSTNRLDPQLSQ